MVERITVNGRLLSIIIRSGFRKDGIEFFTPNEYSQQLAYMRHPAGKLIEPVADPAVTLLPEAVASFIQTQLIHCGAPR